MNKEEVVKLYSICKTPQHIIEHCENVAKVAYQILESYVEKGIEVDVESVIYACLLHDLLRIVDIDDENYSKLCEQYTDEYIEVWDDFRSKYEGMEHPDAVYMFLKEYGEEKIASLIEKHRFEAIVDEDALPFTLAEKIVTYADKRVMHTTLVSLEKRFEDGARRYYAVHHHLVPDHEREAEIYQAYFDLEKELFEKINLTPEDISL